MPDKPPEPPKIDQSAVSNHLGTSFFSTVRDRERLIRGIQEAIGAIKTIGVYTGDNMFVFGRCLGFLRDRRFVDAFERNVTSREEDVRRHVVEHGLAWRNHLYTWAARSVETLEGDFVECGVLKGTSTRIVCETVDFTRQPRRFHLYDVFEPHDAVTTKYGELGPELANQVRARFADMPNVRVVQGLLPEAIDQDADAPEKIALLHLDLNSASAEIGVLERLFERIVPGGIVLLDDYGMFYFTETHDAHDAFFAERGLAVAELPTSQGLVIVR